MTACSFELTISCFLFPLSPPATKKITDMSRYGRIAEWRVERYDGDDNNPAMRVQKNLPLVAFRIYDPELVSSKNPNGRWPPYEYTFYPGDDARSLKEKADLDKVLKPDSTCESLPNSTKHVNYRYRFLI